VYRGVSLLLDRGRIRISTDSFSFPERFHYGKNTDFLKVFVLSYVKLLSDSPLSFSHGDKPLRVYLSFFRRLISKPLLETIREFSGFADMILLSENSTGSDSSTRVFHEFMLDTPVFKEYHMWTRTGRPELLRYVLTFLLFGKKIEYQSDDFHSIALRDWYAVEKELSELTFSGLDMQNLRMIVSEITRPIYIDSLLPSFGPGNVSESGVFHIPDKLRSLSWNRKLAYAFNRSGGFLSLQKALHHELVETLDGDSRSYSRLKMVPKDITKSRSICMEPNAHMYFQQEVLRAMVSMMEESPIRRFVDLRSQDKSQDAAVHGSIYLSTDTIDLSSASDRVHVDLVRSIFDRRTLFYLLATRTSLVETPDRNELVAVKKFAPMGSAVCFPVQCIVFTAICLYAAWAVSRSEATGLHLIPRESFRVFLRSGFHRRRSENTPFTRRYEPPVVYGDDISVDSRTTHEVISTLTRLGFKVNESKSFTSSQSFRESCGVYVYDGDLVTPVRFRLPWFTNGKWGASVFASLIGNINWSRDNGYNHLSSFYLAVLRSYGYKYPLPFTTERTAFGIYTRNKHPIVDAHLRWNADWQIHEERVSGIVPRKVKVKPSGKEDLYLLDLWWRSRVRELPTTPTSGVGLRIRPQETRVGPRWARVG
jgi:hypothetical protein